MISTRRLAAILAADVVGFSALMERDEEGTFRRIQALRTDVVDPLLAEHRGRMVKTTGDGMLAEFASPIAAVGFALKLQKALNEVPDGLRLRIGINLGDIIVEEDGDVYGEGVNVAARLEALCEPGGVLVSSKIHNEVSGKVAALFEDQGEKHVKNISKLVHVFAVRDADGSFPPPPPSALPGPRRPVIPLAGIGAGVLVLAGGISLWAMRAPGPSAPPATPQAGPAAAGPAPAPAGGSHPYDGLWKLTVTCPPSERLQASGYSMTLGVKVTDGQLRGELGRAGAPGAFQIEGPVQRDGAAFLKARGIVNDATRAAGNAPSGALYEYTVDARFAGNGGSGRRKEVRPCELVFER